MTNQPKPGDLSSLEIEEALAGAILTNPDCLYDVLMAVQPEDFYFVKVQYVLDAICALHERNEEIDHLLVIEELRARGALADVGGSAYLTHLTNETPTHIHAPSYARVVHKFAKRRKLMAALGESATVAYHDNATFEALVDKVWTILDDATELRSGGALVSFEDSADQAMDEWLAWSADPQYVRGYRTGIDPFDLMVGGFLPGRVCSLIMPSSGGKSTICRQLTLAFMEQTPGLVVPTEMSDKAYMHGLVTQSLGLDGMAIQHGDPNEGIAREYARLMKQKALFLRSARPSIVDIEQAARKLRRKQGDRPLWMIVDSGSNVTVPKADNIFEQTKRTIGTLARIAGDYGYFVFVTWQINRESYAKEGAGLTSGRGGGDIENDSDYVITVDRAEYKYKTNMAKAPVGWKPGDMEEAKLRVLKSRHNPIAGRTIDLWFKFGKGIYPKSEQEAPPVYTGGNGTHEHDD